MAKYASQGLHEYGTSSWLEGHGLVHSGDVGLRSRAAPRVRLPPIPGYHHIGRGTDARWRCSSPQVAQVLAMPVMLVQASVHRRVPLCSIGVSESHPADDVAWIWFLPIRTWASERALVDLNVSPGLHDVFYCVCLCGVSRVLFSIVRDPQSVSGPPWRRGAWAALGAARHAHGRAD